MPTIEPCLSVPNQAWHLWTDLQLEQAFETRGWSIEFAAYDGFQQVNVVLQTPEGERQHLHFRIPALGFNPRRPGVWVIEPQPDETYNLSLYLAED